MGPGAAMDFRVCLCLLTCGIFADSSSAPNTETTIKVPHRIQKRGKESSVSHVDAVMENYEGYISSGCLSNRETWQVKKNIEGALLEVNFQKENLTISHPNIQTSVYKINPAEIKGLKIKSEDLKRDDASRPSNHSMYFPKSLMERASQKSLAKEMRLACIYLKASCMFQDKQNSSLLNDDILGASLGNMSVANLAEPVEIRLGHNHSLDNFSMTCVFWVEGTGEDSLGSWSTEGCQTDTSQEGVVLCKCNHLTYFAVLLQVSSKSLSEELLAPLTYLSDVGCGVSALACLITIFLYLFTRKLYHDSTTKIHISLLGGLFLLNLSFLASKLSVAQSGLCKATAAFLHYSLLCSLTWMAIEGFHLYMLVVKVYNAYISRYLLKLCAAGWGFPAFVILISFLSMQEVYGEYHVITTGSDYKNRSMCWITSPILLHLTFAYVGGTVFFNMVVLVMVVQKIKQLRARPLHRPKEKRCKDVGTVLGMTFLLGTTWSLGFVSFGACPVPQIFLFTIFNMLQGAAICLWYCFLQCRSGSRRSTASSHSSATSPGL